LKSIILAAGEGKRLWPLAKDVPKCMVKLFGKTLLERQIDVFKSCNVLDISVVTGHKSELITLKGITYFKNKKFDTTNMLETLFCAEEKLRDCVIVSYGDIIFEKKVLDSLIKSEDDISVVIDKDWEKYWELRFERPLDDAESLIINSKGFIQSIGQKVENIEEIQGQYIGLMKFQNKGIDILKNFYKKAKNESLLGSNILNPNIPFERSFMTDFLQGLIHEKNYIKAVPIRNGWLELDSMKDYELYTKKYENGILSDLISLEK